MSTRRSHQRSLEAMQVTLDSEIRSRSEAVRLRKKMESDLNEMELQLVHATKQAAESQKVARQLQTQVGSSSSSSSSASSPRNRCVCVVQVKEQQVELEDKVQVSNQLREQVALLERRCSLLVAEEEELRGVLEHTDHARRAAEHQLVEAAERVNVLATQVRPCTGPGP